MESVGDPHVDPPDRCQIWEALSQYPFHCRTFHPAKFSPPGGDQGVGKPIKPIGWLVFISVPIWVASSREGATTTPKGEFTGLEFTALKKNFKKFIDQNLIIKKLIIKKSIIRKIKDKQMIIKKLMNKRRTDKKDNYQKN